MTTNRDLLHVNAVVHAFPGLATIIASHHTPFSSGVVVTDLFAAAAGAV
jgi:hypothetical protein